MGHRSYRALYGNVWTMTHGEIIAEPCAGEKRTRKYKSSDEGLESSEESSGGESAGESSDDDSDRETEKQW